MAPNVEQCCNISVMLICVWLIYSYYFVVLLLLLAHKGLLTALFVALAFGHTNIMVSISSAILGTAPDQNAWTAHSHAVLSISLSQAGFFSLSKSNERIAPAQCCFCCRCLLIEPFPESALNEEAGKLLLENYEEYAKHAKLMTSIHAQPPKRSACCLTPLLRCLFGQSLCH